jgi:hypothetical protein
MIHIILLGCLGGIGHRFFCPHFLELKWATGCPYCDATNEKGMAYSDETGK